MLSGPPEAQARGVVHNLPAQLTSFVGREADLAQLEGLLAHVRLLTITGTGGCGKTRLAAETAARLAHAYPAGVWWVELGPLAPASPVATTVLSALGLREDPGRLPGEQLGERFADQAALLVLDNGEHVLDDLVAFVAPLLGRSPALTVLTTSREPLGLPGETTWRVPPLRPSDAVALFVDRARHARPNFSVGDDATVVVADICSRLDGLPLAIELAAARVRLLSPVQIQRGLDDRFHLLTGGSKATLPRQQTLTASVEWSHDLLTEAERALLRRLAVFAGGFTLDAAEVVGTGEPVAPLEVLDLLGALVDKSLVIADEVDGESRYRLLETIRQFASARLDDSAEAVAARDRHLGVMLGLADAVDPAFMADDRLTRTLEVERDNLRTALDWALASGRADDAVRVLCGLSHLWLTRGWVREALGWFDRVLAPDAPAASSPLAYRARWARMVLGLITGQPDAAFAIAGELAEQAGEQGDRRYLARLLWVHGTVQVMADPAVGEKTLEEAVGIADDVGDPLSSVFARLMLIVSGLHRDDHGFVARVVEAGGDRFGRASSQLQSMFHALVGWSHVRTGRFGDARHHGETALALAEEIADTNLAGALARLTLVLLDLAQGRVDEAAARLDAAWREPRSVTREDAMLTGARGWVLAAGGDLHQAEEVLAEAVRLAHQIGDGLQIAFCTDWHAGLLRARGDLDGARAETERLRAHARQQHNAAFEAAALRHAAHVARIEGDVDTADDLAQQALARSADGGLAPEVVQGLMAVATGAAALESWEEAARLSGAAAALASRIGCATPPWDQALYDAALAGVRPAVEAARFAELWAEGQALDVDEAVAYARRGRGERKRPSSGWASLTPMERHVVDLVAEGLRNTEIAARLFVAPSTIKTHLGHVFAKLDVSTRAELAALATRRHDTG